MSKKWLAELNGPMASSSWVVQGPAGANGRGKMGNIMAERTTPFGNSGAITNSTRNEGNNVADYGGKYPENLKSGKTYFAFRVEFRVYGGWATQQETSGNSSCTFALFISSLPAQQRAQSGNLQGPAF